jgi:signal transduction histidine kinase
VLESRGCGTEPERRPVVAAQVLRAGSGTSRRRGGLVELGRLIRSDAPTPCLFHATAAAVAQALGIEAACVLEWTDDDRGTLLLRSGTGWMAALAGRTALVLRPWPERMGEGVVLGLDTERSALFRRHGVRCGMTALIAGRRGPIGLLGAFGPHPFGPRTAEFLVAAASLVASGLEHRRRDRERLRAVSRAIRDRERDRMARDLHDEPLQALAAAALAAQHLRSRPHQAPDPAVLDRLDHNLRLAEEGMRTAIAGRCSPEPAGADGLIAALTRLLTGLEADGGIRGELEARLSREPPEAVGRTLYRVAREALANIRRHAAASTVHVSLEEEEGGIRLRVTDDGQGFTAAPAPGHLGLRCLHERVEAAGGRCRVTSRPGRGTTVECWLPPRLSSSWP